MFYAKIDHPRHNATPIFQKGKGNRSRGRQSERQCERHHPFVLIIGFLKSYGLVLKGCQHYSICFLTNIPATLKGIVGKADDFCIIRIHEYRRWFQFLSFVMLFCKGLMGGLDITFALSPVVLTVTGYPVVPGCRIPALIRTQKMRFKGF